MLAATITWMKAAKGLKSSDCIAVRKKSAGGPRTIVGVQIWSLNSKTRNRRSLNYWNRVFDHSERIWHRFWPTWRWHVQFFANVAPSHPWCIATSSHLFAIVVHTAAFLAELIADPLLRRHLLSVVAAVDSGGEQQHLTAMLQVLSLISGVLSLTSPRALRSRVVQAPEYFWSRLRVPWTSPRPCLPSTSLAAPRLRGALARVVLKPLEIIFIYRVRRIVALHME